MSEHIDISVKGIPDFGDVENALDKIGKEAKKTRFSGIFGDKNKKEKPASNNSNNRNDKSYSKTKDRGAVEKTRSAVGVGGSVGGQPQSDFDQLSRGGFYEALQSKVDAVKNAKNTYDEWSSKKKEEKNEKQTSAKNENGSLTTNSSSTTEFKEAIFKNVKIEKMNGGSGANSWGIVPNSSQSSATAPASSSNTENSETKSSGLTKSATGAGAAGILLVGLGALLKAASNFGENHIQAMMSQSSTLGATGSYVGGGGGLFANADVAQSNVARAKITGESILNQGNKIDDQEMKFAAQQGRGLSEIANAMAMLKKESNQSLNFYRGAANQSGFTNLRQSEYFTKIGDLSQSFRSQGFSGNMDSFMSTVAGMQLGGANADPMRKISIAENFRNSSAKGVFGGGILGGLALKEALDANGGDMLKSMIASEGPDGAKLGMSGLLKNVNDPLALAVIGKMTGAYSATESQKLQDSDLNKSIVSASDISNSEVGFNNTLKLQNEKNQAFANSEVAKGIAESMQKASELLLKAVDGIDKVYYSMESLTESIIKGTVATSKATMDLIKMVTP